MYIITSILSTFIGHSVKRSIVMMSWWNLVDINVRFNFISLAFGLHMNQSIKECSTPNAWDKTPTNVNNYMLYSESQIVLAAIS